MRPGLHQNAEDLQDPKTGAITNIILLIPLQLFDFCIFIYIRAFGTTDKEKDVILRVTAIQLMWIADGGGASNWLTAP